MSYKNNNDKSFETEFYTSKDDGHKHEFKVGNVKTSYNAGHSHKIDYNKGIALPSRKHPHTHNLPRISVRIYKALKDKRQLNKGTKIELEHTKNKKIAKVIAIKHLIENPNYYKKASVRGKNKLVSVK